MTKLLPSAFTLLLLTLWLPTAVLSADSAVTTGDPEIHTDELQLELKPLMRSALKVEADAWLQLLKGKVSEISDAEIALKSKLHEISTAEKVEATQENIDEAKRKAGASQDRKEAETLIRDAQQEYEAAVETAQAVTEKVQADAEIHKVTAIATQMAQEKAETTKPEENEADGGNSGEKIDKDLAQRSADRSNLMAYLIELREQRSGLIDRSNLVIDAFEVKGGAVEIIEEYRQYITAVSGIEVDVTDMGATWAAISGWLLSKEGGLRWARNIGLFTAIVLLAMFLARLVGKAVEKALAGSQQTSQLLADFLVTTSRRLVQVIGIIIGLAALEVNIGPLLAVIGAAGFVIAFALQNSLGNFASGILIMVFKPFDVGDLVEIGGVLGTVQSMNLLSVLLRTPDNKAVIIPNNNVWSDAITNVTDADTRRVDLEFGIGYDDDIETAQKIMEQALSEHPLVLKDPAPLIRVHALADSSVNFICRPWVKSEDYWDVYWDLTRTVKERFDEGGVSIPFPQQDIHIIESALVKNDAASSEADEPETPGRTIARQSQSSTDSAMGGDVDLDQG